MTKSVLDIRDEYFDNDKLSAQSIIDLIWHIENESSLDRAIMLVTDARLKDLFSLIGRHLDHEDDFIREITVGCVVRRLKLVEYAEQALKMAQADPDNGPRGLATCSLGAVINNVNPALRKRMAVYLYDVITKPEFDSLFKEAAFDSILAAMNVPMPEQLTMHYSYHFDLISQFKEKFVV